MDMLLLGSLSIILSFLIFVVVQIVRLYRSEKESRGRMAALCAGRAWGTAAEDDENQEPPAHQQRGPVMVGGARRAAVRRRANLANRPRAGNEEEEFVPPLGFDEEGDSDLEDGELREDVVLPDGKVGKKKLAKLEAKAEKRAAAEAAKQEREERKQREAEQEERRKREEEKEKADEAAREELEKKAKEEKEREEHEEYLKLKESFAVEEEGFDQNETLESENMLQDFIEYIKKMKVVNMDELASHFKLKTPEVIERIKTLVANGTLTGVIDDRGKFIYITMDELRGVAKFINQRGRVSVQELAEYSNKLIRLEPEISA